MVQRRYYIFMLSCFFYIYILSIDEITCEYKDGQNILKIKKNIQTRVAAMNNQICAYAI